MSSSKPALREFSVAHVNALASQQPGVLTLYDAEKAVIGIFGASSSIRDAGVYFAGKEPHSKARYFSEEEAVGGEARATVARRAYYDAHGALPKLNAL